VFALEVMRAFQPATALASSLVAISAEGLPLSQRVLVAHH